MALTSGTKLGPYEIVAPLGAGGMGEVYRAHDSRLGRDVAIKILPAAVAKDADRLQRFEQEARTIAALNHPNILGIHDIATLDSAPYLVSELLEGQTLRQKLDAGPLMVRKAIEYALGIAQGLAVAHQKAVVHRDLKPENIFVTRDGRIKILDFGLAKLERPDDKEVGVSVTSPATLPGVVVGTIGYMSPEQVRGEAVDSRSDIFTFGAVLYEMLTGNRAFKRSTAAETMTAILRDEPPELSETGWHGPPGLQRIVGRCLEKSTERRFQSASDLGFALESLSGSSLTQEATRQVRTWHRAWLARVVTVLGLVVAILAAWLLGNLSAKQAHPKFTRLTYQQGYPFNGRFAKDGHTVLYSAQWNNDPLHIYSVRMDYPQSVRVDLPSADLLGLSADGDLELALEPVYHSNFVSGTMAQARIEGGAPRGLENDVIAADFAPDAKTLAVVRLARGNVQLEYPSGKVIYETSGYLDHLRVSPGGEEVAFLEHPVYDDDRGWVAIVDRHGKHRKLTKEFPATRGLAWERDGKEIWFTAADVTTDQQMFAVDLSGKQREILTTPKRIRVLDVDVDGRVLLSSEDYRTEIVGIDPGTGKERPGLEWFNGSSVQDILPDGKAILMEEWGGVAGPLYDTVYRKLDGSAPVLLGPGAQSRFAPDGTQAAAILLTIPPQIVLHPIGTGESRRLALGDIVTVGQLAWFPDGKHLLLVGATAGQARRTYLTDTEGGQPQPLGPADWQGVAVANDGRCIAGSRASGQTVVFDRETQNIQAIPGIAPQDVVQQWTEDGRGLLVQSGTTGGAHVYRVEIATGKRTLLREAELSNKAGSVRNVKLLYAEKSKTYVYETRRIVGSLYVVDGLK
jgi:serine/threonine protein kinase/Tol biopolymer transport system component